VRAIIFAISRHHEYTCIVYILEGMPFRRGADVGKLDDQGSYQIDEEKVSDEMQDQDYLDHLQQQVQQMEQAQQAIL